MSGKTSTEEEEDQWISGEELRTEGSSDEDVSEPRASRKKQKTDVLLKRLLVSSLAFPSSPPHMRLPSIDKTDKVIKPPQNFSKEKHEQLTVETASALLEPRRPRVKFEVGDSPSTDLPEEVALESATGFQPKSLQESLRRSLKVDLSKRHRYEKGETKTTKHLILEMNEFYFEMLDRLKFLRGNLHKNKNEDEDEEDLSIRSEWGFETSDPYVLSILAEIEKDEVKYQQNVQLLEKEKQERKAILQEICASGDCSEPTNQDDEAKAEPQNIDDGDDDGKCLEQKMVKAKGDKDFIAKNKELAKEYGAMSRFCLTDEEKIKLESLLSDIDDTEVNAEDGHHEAAVLQEHDNLEHGFKLDLDEQKTLEELESKLEALSEYAEPSGAQKEIDDLSAAENQGKHWKFGLMQSRLKSIDNDLCIIQDEKNKEGAVSKLEELGDDNETGYKKCLSDLGKNFDGDVEEEDDGGENYQECLSQISFKIEEAREEFEQRPGKSTPK